MSSHHRGCTPLFIAFKPREYLEEKTAAEGVALRSSSHSNIRGCERQTQGNVCCTPLFIAFKPKKYGLNEEDIKGCTPLFIAFKQESIKLLRYVKEQLHSALHCIQTASDIEAKRKRA